MKYNRTARISWHMYSRYSSLSIPPTVRPFEMNKTVIVTLVGLPGSGKSSVCSELVKCNTPNTQMFWIHYDNLIPDSAFIPDTLGFSDDAYTSEWKKYRQRIADCVERLLIERLGLELDSNLSEECLALYLRMPKLPCKSDETRVVLLLDDNFYYSSMRHTYFLLAKRYGLGFLSVACHCPLSVCLSRNSHRSNSVPDHIIIRMERKIEWPDPHVNQWEKHTVTLDCFSLFTPSDLRMILEGINVAMQEPFSYAEEIARLDRSDADREINAHSLIHGLDAVLRSTVGQLMAANDSEWKAKHSGLMSRLKSVVINKMRTNIMKDHPKRLPEEYKEQAVSLFRQLLSEIVS